MKSISKHLDVIDEEIAKDALSFLAKRCGYCAAEVMYLNPSLRKMTKGKDIVSNVLKYGFDIVLKHKNFILGEEGIWAVDKLDNPHVYFPVAMVFSQYCNKLSWPAEYVVKHKYGFALKFLCILSGEYLLTCMNGSNAILDLCRDIVFLKKNTSLEEILVEMDLKV